MAAAAEGNPLGRYVSSTTPVAEVRTDISGLTGESRATAKAAAKAAQGARDLGSLHAELRAASERLGEGVAIDVAPGPSKEVVRVTFRPEHGWWLKCGAGHEGADFDLASAVGLKLEGTPAAENGGPPPLATRVDGFFSFGRDAFGCSIQASPLLQKPGTFTLSPVLEAGLGAAGLTGLLEGSPRQLSQHAAVSLADATGKHSLRLKAAFRYLRPEEGSAGAIYDLPSLQSSKTSISYNFLQESLPSAEEGSRVAATAELSGLLGDVAVARAEASWSRWGRLLGGSWHLTAALGFAGPLEGAATPLQERFFLGGGAGQGSGERLLGFAARGLGPHAPRPQPEEEPPAPRKLFRFGRSVRGWTTETYMGVPMANGKEAAVPQLDYLGGDARLSTEASIRWPLPLLPAIGKVRLHVMFFGAAGALFEKCRPPSLAQDLMQSLRISGGAGIGVPMPGGGFIGFTYAQPFRVLPGDKLQALQLSLSLGNAL
eukprot:TRINITY_DN95072_c0_g1_i1.p1 TRINITY_DN95072_c0_g1~~TRINITY_DN95072_c0_g1_i1.p1  ORF type:complete len:487 (+),score=110.00 TRINITY_DN95072_c0_g1_i1:63-1523(+)